jgi:hypothetical protein
MNKHIFIFLSALILLSKLVLGQEHIKAGNLNPILPGYFADPTIKKIGDTYYIYATTDGNGGGLGPSQVWTSKDFLNWTIQPMNWPNTHWYWAPDMTKGYDGKYYLYYSQPVEIYAASSTSPTGPWTPMNSDGKSIIPNYMIPGVITLDAQTFTDDDGKIYMYWGTWGIYPDHGCAVGLLNSDMRTFEKIKLIPNTDAKDFFEAPYVFKRNGIYYFMYSSGHCEDHTYRVQYAMSKVGPMGPFEYADNNPILSTNEDGTIHGPGHHSLIEENGRYFIVYHRHNNPFSGGGFHRQIAVDEMFFEADGTIKKIVPTHQGVSTLIKKSNFPENIAYKKPVSASSFYNEDFKPSFIADDNNGTLWRAKDNHLPGYITVDLEKVTDIRTVLLQFEYPTYAYQYRIETSTDGNTWSLYADQSKNNRWASPILEHADVKARYVRVYILNTQHPGLTKGIWNIKVYSETYPQQTLWSEPQPMPTPESIVGQLVHIQPKNLQEASSYTSIPNKGLLGGEFQGQTPLIVKTYYGKKAFYFDGQQTLKSTFKVPTNLIGNNPFTVSMWVNNPTVGRYEDVLAYSKGIQDLTRAVFGVGSDSNKGAVTHGAWPDLGFKSPPQADQWNHIVYSFDGYMERIYVNGELQKEQNRMLFVKPNDHFILGASDLLDNHFSGYLADLKIYNTAVSADFIQQEIISFKSDPSYFSLKSEELSIGTIKQVRNNGSVDLHMVTLQNAKVNIVGNRTAFELHTVEDSYLSEILKSNQYTIELDVFENNSWRHYVYLNNSGKITVFQDGKSIKTKKFKAIQVNDNFKFLVSTPVHFINVYPTLFDATTIAFNYAIWKNKLNSPIASLIPKFKDVCRYINQYDAFAYVENEAKDIKYTFYIDGNYTDWKEESFILFKPQSVDSILTVFMKDQFGNISKPASCVISTVKPKYNEDVPNDEIYSLGGAKIPYWGNMQVSSHLDSTKTSISLKKNVWHLGSKHTKWGSNDLLPPFMYKEIKGDFTIQLKVQDVAGLQTKTRTSSEAGIMIRTAKGNSYINNTILTGWNLGNLWRSVGQRMHNEGNNGTGLQFEPYIQVQKMGDMFFLRTSKDGVHWNDLSKLPIVRTDMNNEVLQIGIYQIATNNQDGFGKFTDIEIWQ